MINKYKDLILNKITQLSKYKVELFIVFVLLIYSFLFIKIVTLGKAEPSASSISSQSSNFKNPHIPQNLVTKIQQLQNNSVNVQALFNQSRQNPFNE